MILKFTLIIIFLIGVIVESVFFWPVTLVMWILAVDKLKINPVFMGFGMGLARDMLMGGVIGTTSIYLILAAVVHQILSARVSWESKINWFIFSGALMCGWYMTEGKFSPMFVIIVPIVLVSLRRKYVRQ